MIPAWGYDRCPPCTFRKLLGYGRIGTVGRSRSSVVRDEGEARHLAGSILKRRASAPRRLGVAYRIRELIDPEGWARFHRVAIAPTHEESADREA
jgi:hypothetical protein